MTNGIAEALRAQRRDRVALIATTGQSLSFADVVDFIDHAADALQPLGCASGTRLAIVLPAGPAMAITNLAAVCCAAGVPLNPAYTESEFVDLLRRLRVQAVLHDGSCAALQRALLSVELPQFMVRTNGPFEVEIHGETHVGQRDTNADETLVLHTSGSTSRPKIVPLTHRNLLASARNVARSLELSATDRCFNSLPPFHVGAIVDLLLAPLLAGGASIVADGPRTDVFLTALSDLRPTWHQAVPTMLADTLLRADQLGVDLKDHDLRLIRSVSAPLPDELMADVEARFGTPVVEIYGMTETAGVITSNPLHATKPGTVGVPVGPEIQIADVTGNPLPIGERGEVLVRGPSVMAGYEVDGAPSREAFRGEWLRTGDEGSLDEAGYLRLTGRIKELINRGGEKIAPREIDEVLLTHPDVVEAAAFAIPSSSLGEDVAAAVVLRDGASLDAASIREHCQRHLAEFKTPRVVQQLDALPRAPGGKLQRHRLEHLADKPTAEPTVPETPTERRIGSMWARALGVDAVSADDDFFELGGDSLKVATFVQDLENELGIDLPATALYDHPTLKELAVELDRLTPRTRGAADSMLTEIRSFLAGWQGQRPTTESLLVGWNTVGSRAPFFWCVQGYSEFSFVAENLDGDQPIYGMRSLFNARHKSPAYASDLAARYADEIDQLQPAGAIRVGGFCAGGGIAFEVARRLEARGRDVALLALAEHYTPLPYDGRIALFYSENSQYHDFEGTDWKRYYTGTVTRHRSDAPHLRFFRAGALQQFCAALQTELDRTDQPTTPVDRSVPQRSPTVELDGTPPTIAISGREYEFEVELRNLDSHALDRTAPGGLILANRWKRGGTTRVFPDGTGLISQAVAPDDRARISLRVRAPLRPGRWTLEVDLVNLAGGEAKWGSATIRKTVFVLPGRSVWTHLRQRLSGPTS